MNFDIRELEKITMRITRIPEILDDALEKEVSVQVNALLSNSAKDLAPVDTGTLRQMIDTDGFAYRTPEGVTMGITSHAHYSIYVEYGTGIKGDPAVPHTSKAFWFSYNPNYDDTRRECADNPKFLMWFAQEPNPFMRNALKSTRKIAVRLLAQGVGAVFK